MTVVTPPAIAAYVPLPYPSSISAEIPVAGVNVDRPVPGSSSQMLNHTFISIIPGLTTKFPKSSHKISAVLQNASASRKVVKRWIALIVECLMMSNAGTGSHSVGSTMFWE
jgi:hypothetical protein